LFPEGDAFARDAIAAHAFVTGSITTAVQARAMVKSAASTGEAKDQIAGSIILEVTV
jgi:hypothetical protein